MHRLRTLAAALACLPIAPALAIVGGAPPAPASLTRSVVMVVGSYGTLCTASLIARDLLLTAAHCAQPVAQYQFVDTASGRDLVLKEVARGGRHPQFELKRLFAHLPTADLALLKLARPLAPPFSPLQLDTRAMPVGSGELLTVAGYGVAVRGKSDSGGVLRAATLVVAGGTRPFANPAC